MATLYRSIPELGCRGAGRGGSRGARDALARRILLLSDSDRGGSYLLDTQASRVPRPLLGPAHTLRLPAPPGPEGSIEGKAQRDVRTSTDSLRREAEVRQRCDRESEIMLLRETLCAVQDDGCPLAVHKHVALLVATPFVLAQLLTSQLDTVAVVRIRLRLKPACQRMRSGLRCLVILLQ